MNDLKFEQHAHRNLIAPVLIAFLLLGVVIALVIRHTPTQAVDLTITHTAIYPTHTVYKSDSIVVGSDKAEDNLYVLANLRVDDPLHLPLFLKDFTATVTTSDDQKITTSAAEAKDLPNIYTSFPGLKPLASAPLRRETLIAPGTSVEGMVLLQFPITLETWNHRKSAILDVDLYHGGAFPIAIPFNNKTVSTNFDQ
ncbi:MAG TPA: hypothetical protein VMU57_19225 [Edaphobacter sp.]|uniref:hypothetical protein n=1 Tax=Edaphobacter sp. TaxID=1934404 RepID=UPI002B69814F|nr:hypothetical protein [Edaphobacter sp.]HUZ97040.1 hypothetical protein [Edaphobacter sp.]